MRRLGGPTKSWVAEIETELFDLSRSSDSRNSLARGKTALRDRFHGEIGEAYLMQIRQEPFEKGSVLRHVVGFVDNDDAGVVRSSNNLLIHAGQPARASRRWRTNAAEVAPLD